MRRERLICFLLATVTVAVYWQVAGFDFVNFDDPAMVLLEPLVYKGLTWKGLWWGLTTSWFEYWHPVTWWSHMLDCELFGLNPGWHHLMSLGFHVANTLLLFLVLRRLTGALWRSAIVAALFALHPLHAESVAWIAERKDLLSAFFFILTLWAWTRYAEKLGGSNQWSVTSNQTPSARHGTLITDHRSLTTDHRSLYYLLSLFFFACGLMSKPMLVTLPFVLLLLDYWPLGRMRNAECGMRNERSESTQYGSRFLPSAFSLQPLAFLLLEKLPFFALSVGSCLMTYRWALTSGNTISSETVSWGFRLANLPVSYARYLGKLFWPADLAAQYPMPGHWPWSQVAGAVAILVLITLFVVRRARSAPYGIVGWLIFLGMLFPTMRLVQSGVQSIADRYTYLPLIGLFIALVWGAADLGRAGRFGRNSLVCLTLAVLAACGIMTSRQLAHWRNTISLFEHIVTVTADNPSAHRALGYGYQKAGDLDRAMLHFRLALAGGCQGVEATILQANMAQLLASKQRWQEAADLYFQVAPAATNEFWLHEQLASTLLHLGRTKEAAQHLESALNLNPKLSLETLNDLAWALATSPQAASRDGAQAVRFAERACELTQYKMTVPLGTLAAAYAQAGRFSEAVTTAEMACTTARQAGQEELLARNQQLLELYRAGQPYREPAGPSQPAPTH